MKPTTIFACFVALFSVLCTRPIGVQTSNGNNKVLDQIKDLLKYYQAPHKNKFPDSLIQDPLMIPKASTSLLTMFNMTVHGIREYELVNFTTNLSTKKMELHLKFQKLYVRGMYIGHLVVHNTEQSPFEVVLMDVDYQFVVSLDFNYVDGKYFTQLVDMELKFSDCTLDLVGSNGFGARFTETTFDLSCSAVYHLIHDSMMEESVAWMRSAVEWRLRTLFAGMPVPLPLLSVTLARWVSAHVRLLGLEVHRMHTFDTGLLAGQLTANAYDTEMHGLSTVWAVDEVELSVHGQALRASAVFHAGPVTGTVWWILRSPEHGPHRVEGSSNFIVANLVVRAASSQWLGAGTPQLLEGPHLVSADVQLTTDGLSVLGIGSQSKRAMQAYVRSVVKQSIADTVKSALRQTLAVYRLDSMLESGLDEFGRMSFV